MKHADLSVAMLPDNENHGLMPHMHGGIEASDKRAPAGVNIAVGEDQND
jgi:hypothetical protein